MSYESSYDSGVLIESILSLGGLLVLGLILLALLGSDRMRQVNAATGEMNPVLYFSLMVCVALICALALSIRARYGLNAFVPVLIVVATVGALFGLVRLLKRR